MPVIISLILAVAAGAFLKVKSRQIKLPALGFALVLAFCVTMFLDVPFFYDDTVIEATGEKNENSLGVEIFLAGVMIDGKFEKLSDSDIKNGKWFWLDGNAYGWRPSTDERRVKDITDSISIHLPVCSNRCLVFYVNSGQGIALINGEPHDFYSEDVGTISCQLPYSKTLFIWNKLFETLLYICVYIVGLMGAILVPTYFERNYLRIRTSLLNKPSFKNLLLFICLLAFCVLGIFKNTRYYDYPTTLLLANSEFSYNSRALTGNIINSMTPYISKTTISLIKWATWLILYSLISYLIIKVVAIQKNKRIAAFLLIFPLCQPSLFLTVYDDLRTDVFLILLFIVAVAFVAVDKFLWALPIIAIAMLLINETACLCFAPQIIMLLVYKTLKDKKIEYIIEMGATVAFTLFLSFITIRKGRLTTSYDPAQILQHMQVHTDAMLSADPLVGLNLDFSSVFKILMNYIASYKTEIMIFFLLMLPMLILMIGFSIVVFRRLKSKDPIKNLVVCLLILSSLCPMSATLISVDFPRYIAFVVYCWFAITYFLIFDNKLELEAENTCDGSSFTANTYGCYIQNSIIVVLLFYLLFDTFGSTIPYIPTIYKIMEVVRGIG